jgi:hypothetical protein
MFRQLGQQTEVVLGRERRFMRVNSNRSIQTFKGFCKLDGAIQRARPGTRSNREHARNPSSFGPFNDDINRVRAVYAGFTRNRVRQLRSGDGGSSWTEIPNELTSHGHVHTRTNVNPGVTALPQSGLYVIGWSHPNSIPTWLRTDGDRFVFRDWLYYGGERSLYGPAYASDNNQTTLWAWVTNDDRGTIKVVASRNQALQWFGVNAPANARTGGTPALCWTRVNGQSTWILAWSNFDRANQNDTSLIFTSISTNDGWNWSVPVALNTTHKALSGVSAAATPNNRIEVAIAWAPDNAANHAGINAIRTFVCDINGGRVRQLSVMASNGRGAVEATGLTHVGSFRVAMVNDSECLLLWAIPSWPAWADYERAWAPGGALEAWQKATVALRADWRRSLLVDAPLAPLRLGRQPAVGDRRPLEDIE